MKKIKLLLMVLAVAFMTAFYSCGPSSDDQAKSDDMTNELVGTFDNANEEVVAEEETTEEVVAEEETTEENVEATEETTEDTPTE